MKPIELIIAGASLVLLLAACAGMGDWFNTVWRAVKHERQVPVSGGY
jgi:hypothetical protein